MSLIATNGICSRCVSATCQPGVEALSYGPVASHSYSGSTKSSIMSREFSLCNWIVMRSAVLQRDFLADILRWKLHSDSRKGSGAVSVLKSNHPNEMEPLSHQELCSRSEVVVADYVEFIFSDARKRNQFQSHSESCAWKPLQITNFQLVLSLAENSHTSTGRVQSCVRHENNHATIAGTYRDSQHYNRNQATFQFNQSFTAGMDF